jgi:hypothetical protein
LVVATVTTTTTKSTTRVKSKADNNDSDDDCNGSQDLYCDLLPYTLPSIPLKTIVAETLDGITSVLETEDLEDEADDYET